VHKIRLLEAPLVPATECVLARGVGGREAGDRCHVGEDVESDQEWRVVYGPALAISIHVRKLERMARWNEASWVSISSFGDHPHDSLENEISTSNEK
jgi:hypothetical protein